MRRYSFIIAALFLLSACADVERNKQLSALDELHDQLESIGQQVADHRCDTLNTWLEHVHAVQDDIRENYHTDTLSLDFARKLDEFKQMTFDLEQYQRLQLQLDSLLDPQRNALEQLQTDISNGSGKTVKYREYVEFERKRIQVLQTLGDSLVANKIRSFKAYNGVYNEMQKYALLLMQTAEEK